MDVAIYDEVPGLQRNAVLRLDVRTPTITAAALIRARVELEAERLWEENSLCVRKSVADALWRSLVVPGWFRGQAPSTDAAEPDVEAMVAVALDSFRRGGFFLLVGDRQVETLEEDIDLRAAVDVTFLRLMPLQGG